MKKTVMICDRCGVQYDPAAAATIPEKNSRGLLKATRTRITISYMRPDGCRWRDTFDLCPGCSVEVACGLFPIAVNNTIRTDYDCGAKMEGVKE